MSNTNTARIITSGVQIEVERVSTHHTVHGTRGPRIYVRVRAASSKPGIDEGPRTCLSLLPEDAKAFGILLQQSAGGAA